MGEDYERPDWDEYFLEIMRTAAKRATCDRGRSGAVIVKDNRIMTTGYVGSPPGLPHCDDAGHFFKETWHEDGSKSLHCVRTTHAEMNALLQAAKKGIQIDGSTCYCKMEPCFWCAKALIGAGIVRVVAEKMYHGAQDTRDLFKQAGVELVVVNKELEKYEGQDVSDKKSMK